MRRRLMGVIGQMTRSKLIGPVTIAAAALATAAGVAFATAGGGSTPARSAQTGCRADAGGSCPAAPRHPGKQGIASSRGPAGRSGPVGPVGPAGVRGLRGPTGPTGPAGPTGAAGATGPVGPVGPTGSRGPTGALGVQGPAGAAGPAGPVGPAGAAGPAGPGGPAGPPGPQGDRGSQGVKGDQGLQGERGPAGPQGTAGLSGIPGPRGEAGAAGEVGPKGPTGPSGPTGPAGPRGAEGPPGDPGGAIASFDELDGIACNGSGSVRISYDPSGAIGLACAADASPGPARVRINEIQTGTSASAADEFVELSNTGTTNADISGWKVVYRSAAGSSDTTLATIPQSTTLAPGAFYVLGGSAYAGTAAANQSFSSGLAAAGGAVGLRDASGALVDGAGWGTASNAIVEGEPAPAPPASAPPGSSIVRLPDGHDTDSNAADFSVASTATPGEPNQ
jgi:Lamin Tail Domain/Collagen triple helix repeat (20 copies)